MNLVTSFVEFLQQVAFVFTAPTFDSFVTILTGWIFARRRVVTRMIQAADAVETKHHSAFHRVFSAARWSLDELGLATLGLIEPWRRRRRGAPEPRRYAGPQTRAESLRRRHAPRPAAQHPL